MTKGLRQIEVRPEIHKRMCHVAIEEDIALKDLTSAVLEKALDDGHVVKLVKEKFPRAED